MVEKIDILIVEDDSAIYNMYEAMLRSFTSYSYKTATNEEEFFELTTNYRFRLCIMDLRISDSTNGVELSLHIKEKYPDIIIYVMTGFSHIFDGFDPSIAGISKVFNKPGDFRLLCDSIVADLS